MQGNAAPHHDGQAHLHKPRLRLCAERACGPRAIVASAAARVPGPGLPYPAGDFIADKIVSNDTPQNVTKLYNLKFGSPGD